MTIVEDLTEPLLHGEILNPGPSIGSSVFTATESYSAVVTKSASNTGHATSNAEEKGSTRWVWGEVCEQCWLAGPIMAMYLLQYVMNVAGTVFVGHLGAFPLAALTLANAFTSMTGFFVLAGMANALETLCGQAYGAKQYHLLGVFLQRAIVIFTAVCVPIGVVWFNMDRILVAVGEDAAVAQAAQSYAYWLLPASLLFAVLFPLIKFFQTQRAVYHLMFSSALMVLVHVPLCWLVIDHFHLGLNGFAIAYNISLAVNVGVLFSFIRFAPRFNKTFSSLSRDAFHDFGEFFGLAIPSATMSCLEHWSQEILVFLAGLLPNSKLNISSFAICVGLLSLSNMIALALGVATSVRVSNALGAGKARAARSVLAVSVVLGLVHGILMANLIYSLRDIWGLAFTNDVEVVQHVARTAPCLAALALLYALGAILSGVVRGIGWQRAGAMANLGAYYAVGLPVAVISVFVFQFDARGLWLGMGCGLVTQIVALISIILCPNWDHLAQEALLRAHSFSSRLPTLAVPLLKPLVEDGPSPQEPLKSNGVQQSHAKPCKAMQQSHAAKP